MFGWCGRRPRLAGSAFKGRVDVKVSAGEVQAYKEDRLGRWWRARARPNRTRTRAPSPETAGLTQPLKAPRLAQETEVWVLGVGASMFAVMPAAGEQGSLKRKEVRR